MHLPPHHGNIKHRTSQHRRRKGRYQNERKKYQAREQRVLGKSTGSTALSRSDFFLKHRKIPIRQQRGKQVITIELIKIKIKKIKGGYVL